MELIDRFSDEFVRLKNKLDDYKKNKEQIIKEIRKNGSYSIYTSKHL